MSNDIFTVRSYPCRSGDIGDWYAIIRAEMACEIFNHGIDRAKCMLISRGKSGGWFKLGQQDFRNWGVNRNNLNDAVRKLIDIGIIEVNRDGSHKRQFRLNSRVYSREK